MLSNEQPSIADILFAAFVLSTLPEESEKAAILDELVGPQEDSDAD